MILQPILNQDFGQFYGRKDLYNPMVIAIPENVTTANYELASQFMDYWRTLGNTILVSLTIALLQIAVVQWLDMDLQDLNSRLRSSGFCV